MNADHGRLTSHLCVLDQIGGSSRHEIREDQGGFSCPLERGLALWGADFGRLGVAGRGLG
eukprot:COSAG06_NODE_16647_length_989_cov_0.723596_1_plen_59_part_10